MSTAPSLRTPPSLRFLAGVFLLGWMLVALFPLVWIAVQSVRLPVDAFSSNPFTVLRAPGTLAAEGGVSVLGLLGVIAIGGGLIYWLRRHGSDVAYRVAGPRRVRGWLAVLAMAAVALVIGVWVLQVIPLGAPAIGLTFAHYRQVWIADGFHHQFLNSMLVTGGVVTISLSVGTLAAYGFARTRTRLAFWLLIIALVFRAMPHSVLVAGYLPVFISSREWLTPLWQFPLFSLISADPPTLYGKPWAVIVVLVAINQPFTIWLLRSFFASIPAELDEAAAVDGCTPFGAFRRVIMPVMWPGVITAGLFSFLLAYNDYIVAALLLDAQSQTMVPTISQYINSETNAGDQLRAVAAAVSITAPLFLLIMAFQRNIVSGLVQGAVKG